MSLLPLDVVLTFVPAVSSDLRMSQVMAECSAEWGLGLVFTEHFIVGLLIKPKERLDNLIP